MLIRSYDWGWDLEVRCGNHNHAPSLDATAHHGHRKRDLQAHGRETIQQLTQIGVEPRRISAAVLSQNPSTLITRTDIYNERSRARQEHLGDRSPLEALLDELKGDDYWIVKWSEANGRLENLFFASSLQVELMRCFPDILVMDSTYKTNRYRMPLLHFGGTSPMNSYFSSAFCFLVGESEDEYTWAIEQFNTVIREQDLRMPNVVVTDNCRAMKNALTTIFPELPQLLCTWHIAQLVQHRIRVAFNEALYEEGTDDYENVKERRLQCARDWQEVSSLEFSVDTLR